MVLAAGKSLVEKQEGGGCFEAQKTLFLIVKMRVWVIDGILGKKTRKVLRRKGIGEKCPDFRGEKFSYFLIKKLKK